MTTELRPGGAEKCLTQLALGLDHSRFEPRVYSLLPAPPAHQFTLVDQLTSAGIAVEFVGLSNLLQLPSAIRRLRRLTAAQSPDLVQCFLFHANLLAPRSVRGTGAVCVAGLRVAQKNRVRRWAARAAARDWDAAVCVSEDVRRHAIRCGLPAGRLSVIPNAVDAEMYAPNSAASTTGGKSGRTSRTVLYAGRLEWQKGVDILLQAWPAVVRQVRDARLELVGEGEAARGLQAQCRRSGCADSVEFCGWQRNVPQRLAGADLVVLPSRWEGMPNVLLESMASETPVVVSDVEGVREALGPLSEQQVVAPGDPAALAGRIVEMLQNPAQAQELGRRNRQRAMAEFSVVRMVAAYSDLWDAAIAAARDA